MRSPEASPVLPSSPVRVTIFESRLAIGKILKGGEL
jgi:hypothetical protein